MSVSAIFLDLDEVLADWLTPTLRLLGRDPEQAVVEWAELSPRPWDVFEALGMSANKAWSAIDNAGAEHWANLPLHPWSLQLYSHCSAIAPTYLLTSPSLSPSCAAGKVEWIQRHFGKGFRDFLIGPAKVACARPGAVLIDDSPINCRKFIGAGGGAILFPGLGNDLHTQRKAPLIHVHAALAEHTRS